MKYKPLLLSPLGLIPAGIPVASAADMALKAQPAVTHTPNWAGFYAGLNIGAIADHSHQTAFAPATSASGNYCWISDCNFANSQAAVGLLGGVQIGYNFQTGPVVYGLEADFDLSNASKTTSSTNAYTFAGNATSKTGVESFNTVRLRLGYTFDRTIIYATGGLAYAKMRNTFQGGSGGIATPAYSWSDTGWRTGYTIGGGLEYMFDSRWSVKGEALYYGLGSKDHVSVGSPGPGFDIATGLNDRMTGVVARVGLNYMFH